MKRIIAILTAVILTALTLAGCSGQTVDLSGITMDDIIRANHADSLHAKHDRFGLTVTESGSLFRQSYSEKDGCHAIVLNDGSAHLVLSADTHLELDPDGSYLWTFNAGGMMDTKIYDGMVFDSYAALESITDVQQEGRKLLVTTELEGSLCDEAMKLEPGTALKRTAVYTLDAKTLELSSCAYVIDLADGGQRLLSGTMDYSAEQPQWLSAILERAETAEATRTVTVVLDPKTDNEKAFSITVPSGDGVTAVFADNYGNDLYTDPECTNPYFGGNNHYDDATVYAPADD